MVRFKQMQNTASVILQFEDITSNGSLRTAYLFFLTRSDNDKLKLLFEWLIIYTFLPNRKKILKNTKASLIKKQNDVAVQNN